MRANERAGPPTQGSCLFLLAEIAQGLGSRGRAPEMGIPTEKASSTRGWHARCDVAFSSDHETKTTPYAEGTTDEF